MQTASANHPGQGNKISRVTDFDAVNEALSFANTIASRVVALADELLGCAPEGISGDPACDSPNGVLPRMALSAHHTRGRLGDAAAALDRIQRALP